MTWRGPTGPTIEPVYHTVHSEDGQEYIGFAVIPANAPGVLMNGDWDPLGMRGTVSPARKEYREPIGELRVYLGRNVTSRRSKMYVLNIVTLILVIIGGLNLGLVNARRVAKIALPPSRKWNGAPGIQNELMIRAVTGAAAE
jgi:hypothetical protein